MKIDRKIVVGLLAMLNDIENDSEGRYPSPDPGCIDCTEGTVPNAKNTGRCARHAAQVALGGKHAEPVEGAAS